MLPVVPRARMVRGNLRAIMRECFTSFAMTMFSRCSYAPHFSLDRGGVRSKLPCLCGAPVTRLGLGATYPGVGLEPPHIQEAAMRQVRRRLAIGTMECLVGVTVLALGLAGLASRTEAEVINACVNKVNGGVRIVAPGTACKQPEDAIAWNIEGPAGATGPTGALGPIGTTGVAGPAGPAGPVGVTGAAGPAGAVGPAGAAGAAGPIGAMGLAGPAGATGDAGPIGPAGDVFAFTCPPDSVRSGRTCIDTYEVSVWQTTDALTIVKIKDGTVTLTDLTPSVATQRGVASDDYGAGCPDTGNGCKDFYAVSIPGVTPSAFITWFQATAAARNANKRLPSNAEWQAAALGTPDGAPCIVSAAGPGLTGTVGCVSDGGAFDMVGNLWEWVADWVPLSTTCVTDLFGTGDANCLAGASTAAGPGALIRGGYWFFGSAAGVFAVAGDSPPSSANFSIGFRAAR